MAINTAAKRKSALATRRLPWFRRFEPVPASGVSQADRQQVWFVYNGIAPASAPASVSGPICIVDYQIGDAWLAAYKLGC